VKRYELDTTGISIYLVLIDKDKNLRDFKWRRGTKTITMLHEWDNSDYRSGCYDFNAFVSRNYVLIECLNSKLLVYPRF
jgi:hypothetical protein